ncbi:MAG TPA: hypothetical protein VHF44_01725 [Nitrososphaeraceae archaeon]|nr:hypothetical protein [Nitrososphaeraceae archaeon]
MNILVSIFFLLIANNSNNIIMENHMVTALESADLALRDIRDAERNGAEISSLIEKFNTALGLIEQANTSKYSTCFDYDNCLDSAKTIFNSISKDSVILKDEANRVSSYTNVIVVGIYLPLIAFFSLLFIFYLYKTWKSIQKDKFLNMQIKERREK